MAPKPQAVAASGATQASGSPAGGWASLPADVLRLVFRHAEELQPPLAQAFCGAPEPGDEDDCLMLADMFSASEACKAWRAALSASPAVAQISIGGASPGKRAWVQRARPGTRRLRLHGAAAGEQGQAMLRALCGEVTEEAEVASAPRCLPDPALLPNLRCLTVNHMACDLRWLERLASLPRLATLELSMAALPAQQEGSAGQALTLPALPALRRLSAYLAPGALTLRIALDRFPSLQEVELFGSSNNRDEVGNVDRGSAELVDSASAGSPAGAPPPASRLRQLTVRLSRARLDFGAMPGLEEAELWVQELEGAASLAQAAALSELRLGSASNGFDPNLEHALDKGWVEAMLGALPPTLRTLRLAGTFVSPGVAARLVALRTLRVLALELMEEDMGQEEEVEVEELGPGPLWSALRALRWESDTPLPQALAGAHNLRVLHWRYAHPKPGPEGIKLLASLHSLRHLLVAARGQPPDSLEGELRAALPGLQTLSAGNLMLGRDQGAFLEAAARAGAWDGA